MNAPRRTGLRLALLGGVLLPLVAGCMSTDTDAESMEDIDVNVPSQAQADAAAAQRINAQNADHEYQKLVDEIDSESEGEDSD